MKTLEELKNDSRLLTIAIEEQEILQDDYKEGSVKWEEIQRRIEALSDERGEVADQISKFSFNL